MSKVPRQLVADVDSPATWLQDHGDCLFAYALARVRDVEHSEDLVQETLLAAIEQRDTFQHRSSVRTWLVGILKHKISDHFRRSGAAVRARSAISDGGDPTLAGWLDQQFTKRGKWKRPPERWRDHTALSAGELDELRTALDACLDSLPMRARDAILLTERSRMPATKVCKVLCTSTTNVGVLLFRARTALRQCLEIRWFGRKRRPDSA